MDELNQAEREHAAALAEFSPLNSEYQRLRTELYGPRPPRSSDPVVLGHARAKHLESQAAETIERRRKRLRNFERRFAARCEAAGLVTKEQVQADPTAALCLEEIADLQLGLKLWTSRLERLSLVRLQLDERLRARKRRGGASSGLEKELHLDALAELDGSRPLARRIQQESLREASDAYLRAYLARRTR